MGKVILVVPCYNEAKRLNISAYEKFLSAQQTSGFCFVNDGSQDNTEQIIQQLAAKYPQQVLVVSLTKNSGKAEAVRSGMLRVKQENPEMVGYFDADLAVPLEELTRAVAIFQSKSKLLCLLASRVRLLGYAIKRKPARHYLGRIFATLASLLLEMEVYDTQCGLKLFSAQCIEVLFKEKFISRWIFDLEVLLRLKGYLFNNRSKFPGDVEEYINEFPLLKWTDIEGSKIKLHHGVRVIWDLAGLYFLRKRLWLKA